ADLETKTPQTAPPPPTRAVSQSTQKPPQALSQAGARWHPLGGCQIKSQTKPYPPPHTALDHRIKSYECWCPRAHAGLGRPPCIAALNRERPPTQRSSPPKPLSVANAHSDWP